MKYLKLLCLFLIVSWVKIANSQDFHFSQFYNNQVFLNPAMSGLAFGPRISLHYRNQYPGIGAGAESGYTTYAVAYDQHIEKINSGFGVLAMMDRTANGIYNRYNIFLTYAYQIRLSRKLGLKIGVYGGLNSANLDWNKLKFYDQIDPVNGFFGNIATTEVPPASLSNNNFDGGFGFLFFNQNFYAGVTMRHLTFQKNFFYNSNNLSLTPLYLGSHAGMIKMFNKRNKTYLALNLNYAFQYKNHELVPVALFNYELINMGMGFRHTFKELESLIFYLGVTKGIVRVNYSYDHTMSNLAGYTGGSHELCFRFLFGGDDNSLRPKSLNGIIDCPTILKN